MRLFPILLLALLFGVSTPFAGPASAHAIVIDSAPKAGASVPPGAAPVTIQFNSRIDAARSTLTLLDDQKTPLTIPLLPTEEPDRLVARLVDLKPGTYRLRWQVLALDGHVTRGDIPFTVAP